MPGRLARRGATVAVALLGAGLVASVTGGSREEPAAAVAPASDSPPPPIAFSHGGRIFALRPDGSGRVRLTRTPGDGREAADAEPAWSPDGRTLAFVRRVGVGEQQRTLIYLMDTDGRPARPLSSGDGSSPTWSPDGRRVAYVRHTDDERAIVVADVAGGAEAVLLRAPRDPDHPIYLDGLAWSPDGEALAFTRTWVDRRFTVRPSLFALDADDGGEPRLLIRDGKDAAWSPDGRRIAFASVRDRNGKRCWDQCQLLGELYVMDADGTDPVRLTRNRGDDRSPSWSPDGRRIAFASDRNYPQVGNSEIYSIRPNGACLTWLTNGTPGSDAPAWRNVPSGAGACGAKQRRARVDLDLRAARAVRGQPVFWLGARYRGLLPTNADVARDGQSHYSVFVHYEDCARFDPRDCPPPLQLQQVSVCPRWGSSTLGVVNDRDWGSRVRAFAKRGVLLIDMGDASLGLIAGSGHVRLFHTTSAARGRRQLLRVVRDLRLIDKPRASLPAPALPRRLLRTIAQTRRAYGRLGTIPATARELKAPRRVVARRLQFGQIVASLPRVRAVECPGRR